MGVAVGFVNINQNMIIKIFPVAGLVSATALLGYFIPADWML